jgi:head-tail adaptor
MRAGNLYSRVKFYPKVITRGEYGDSIDTWPIATISTRGEVRWVGGSKVLSNEEKTYSRNMELTVRYRTDITETMKVQLDGMNDLYAITYIEVIGRKEGLKLTLEKLSDGLSNVIVEPPTGFTASVDNEVYNTINLAWTNNSAADGVVIERSLTGNMFSELVRIPKNDIPVTSFTDEDLMESTRYFYRIRAFNYSNYSEYAMVDDAYTDAEPI